MKKTIRFLMKIVIALSIVILCLIIFLLIYYNRLDKKISEETMKLRPDTEKKVRPPEDLIGDQLLNLLPKPQKVIIKNGTFTIPTVISYSVADSFRINTGNYLGRIRGVKNEFVTNGGSIAFSFNRTLPAQGYKMDITPGRINIEYSSLQGIYYSCITLKVLNYNYSGKIPCAVIEDYPDLEVRGMMIDIGRNKIPKLETLLMIAEMLADLKYNHLELYIEGFAFAYPSFRELWEKTETPLTGDEIKELDAFCRDNFIDLVPNQNMFGHMMAWLATDRFRGLAESPKGYKLMGLIDMKGTLDPSDPASIELVTRMTDDLLPNFTSENFNADLDEPFELGNGKSKKLVAEKGVGVVYLDYALKIHELLKSRNKKMLMWGDIVLRHPDLLTKLPEDITLLDWGYESVYPYEKNCKTLQAAGVNYMVCPGTNSWTSITGRTDNMLKTISNATTYGSMYGAKGMLNTDWGDMGHWQYLPVSYAGFTAGAALSWNSKGLEEPVLSRFLSSYIFRDNAGEMGSIALNLGRYNRYEELPLMNMTSTMLAFQYGLRDRVLIDILNKKMFDFISGMMKDIAPEIVNSYRERMDNRHAFDYKGLTEFIDSMEVRVQNASLHGDDGLLISDEYMNAIRLIRLGTNLQYYIGKRSEMNLSEEKTILLKMKELAIKYLEENRVLWISRNKPGGYETSITPLVSLLSDIDKKLAVIEKPGFSRSLDHLMEKITTAAAAIYLNHIN
jgi:hexosaminidase